MFTITTLANPVYSNAEGTGIICDVQFNEISGTHPFHATSYDPEPHGVQIYNDLIAGKYGPIAAYAPVEAVQPKTQGLQAA
jgi:hypothetical protein